MTQIVVRTAIGLLLFAGIIFALGQLRAWLVRRAARLEAERAAQRSRDEATLAEAERRLEAEEPAQLPAPRDKDKIEDIPF
jgi:hypothetical protein